MAAIQDVITTPAIQNVIAFSALDVIRTSAPIQSVITTAAVENIVSRTTINIVISNAGIHLIGLI